MEYAAASAFSGGSNSCSSWLELCAPRAKAQVRLVCFAHAGGSSSVFYPWSEGMGESIEVWAVQLPGRGERMDEELITDFQTVIDNLGPAIAQLTDKPLAIFGHSLGARLGFEVARWLRRQGAPAPVHLFASASKAPHVPRIGPKFSQMPEEGLIEKSRQLNGMPKLVLANPELLRTVLPVIRADFAIAESYLYREEPPLNTPIDAFYGVADPEVGKQHAADWRVHSSSEFSVKAFNGDHFFLQPCHAAVVHSIASALYSLNAPRA
jgi:medium-chain acyl-[acyl-carrier-protein] hydrolase